MKQIVRWYIPSSIHWKNMKKKDEEREFEYSYFVDYYSSPAYWRFLYFE